MRAPAPRDAPPTGGAGADLPTIVVGHGPRTDLLVVATVYPSAIAVLLTIGWLTLPKLGPALGVSGFATVVVGVFLLCTWGWLSQGTEEVVLSPQGIQRRRRAAGTSMLVDAKAFVGWEWLDPTARGAVRFGFAYFRWHRPGGYLTWFQLPVTPTQAAAIRAYPACPAAYRDPDTPLH
jgi:hypothetical protein